MAKILVLGSGGREHALVWHLLQHGHQVECSPGSDAISEIAPTWVFKNFQELGVRAKEEMFDEIIVGPEKFLFEGVADYLEGLGLKVFGPRKIPAQLETSKSFAKEFCERNKVATAKYIKVKKPEEVGPAIYSFKAPYVIKASGLAAGKGVWIGDNRLEAERQAKTFLEEHDSVVIEEFIGGREVSCFYLIDGDKHLFLGAACDHKRLLNDDKGPNTGGMGAYSPPSFWSDDLQERIENKILQPTLFGLKNEVLTYRGFLFLGLMILPNGEPLLLEYNCRLGDPEAQVILLRLKSSLFELIESLRTESSPSLDYSANCSLNVVLASKDYPASTKSPVPLPEIEAGESGPCVVFHAGTRRENEEWIGKGGRIVAVTALGSDLKECRQKVYSWIEDRKLAEKLQFRTDIGSTLEQNRS